MQYPAFIEFKPNYGDKGMKRKSMKRLSVALLMMCFSTDYGWSTQCDLIALTPSSTRFDQMTKDRLLQSCPVYTRGFWLKETCIKCREELTKACAEAHWGMNQKAFHSHCSLKYFQ